MSDNLDVPKGNGETAHSRSHRISPAHSFEMDDSAVLDIGAGRDNMTSSQISTRKGTRAEGVARHTLGLLLLLGVVFLWTGSSFLGSSIFADSSYAKPFFLTYLNTSTFLLAMIPSLSKAIYTRYREGTLRSTTRQLFSFRTLKAFWKSQGYEKSAASSEDNDEARAFLNPGESLPTTSLEAQAQAQTLLSEKSTPSQHLSLIPTASLAFTFCILWFGANYFAMACLQYTTVASTTILTSTSSVWTLLIGSLTQTEKFTWRKLCGVLASLGGIMLISSMDLSAPDDSSDNANPGEALSRFSRTLLRTRALDTFPDKTVGELAFGDAMALLSAIIYGFYTITLKRSTLKAAPLELNMPVFFGLVGLFNCVLLFPLFPILHYTGIEPFQFPPSARIWFILITNSISSFGSDIMWAYAMVFTSPLVVTVGLSLTIPISLVGEMIIQARYEGWVYWVGAMIVVGSFVFVDREEVKEEELDDDTSQEEGIDQDGERDGLESGRRRGSRLGDSMDRRPSLIGGGNDSSRRTGDEDGDEEEEDMLGEIIDDDDEHDGHDLYRDRMHRQVTGLSHLDND